MKIVALLLLGLVAAVTATIHYKDTFADGDKWKDRWVQSSWKKSSGEAGNFQLTHGKWYGDAEDDKGIQTANDARFYAWTSKIAKPFSNEGKTLVLQFSVKHEQSIDCGGGYIKLMPASTDQSDFKGDSEYFIMFGPDICGTSTRRIHVILTYKGKNHLIKKEISAETDQLTHVYTLILRPDQTYEVRVDGNKKESGSLLDDWDFLPPRKIKDPAVSKPSDWVDEPMMDDPSDTKPADWDAIPKQIPDPDAKKPEDWDDEADGTWEPPKIDNPDFEMDDKIYAFKDIGFVGFDLWQVKAGTIFDNIIVTDSVEEAESLLDSTFKAHKDAEKTMKDDADKKQREKDEAERKKAEEERKKKEDEEEDEDDDDDKKEDKDEL